MFLFPNEELAFPDEEKQNARVEIAFAARDFRTPAVEITFSTEEK